MNALLLRSRRILPRALARNRQSTAVASYDQSVDIFPSIVIGPNKSIVPKGPFAEAQAQVSFWVWLQANVISFHLCYI